jgi:hypothetical protein
MAAPAVAVNVVGTNGSDVLRGTVSGDWINGKSGNDRLFGLGGNDILTGGPGTDFLDGGAGSDRLLLRDGVRDRGTCGPGRDTVVADRIDVTKRDCEVVLRPDFKPPTTPPPPAPRPPPAPPPPPPPPPPPAAIPVSPGSYKGATQTGNFVFFDVLENRAVRGWRVNDVRRPCDTGGTFIYGPVDLGNFSMAINQDGQFSTEGDYNTTIVWDENGDKSPAQAHYRIAGVIQGTAASGTILSTFSFARDGRQYRCSNGNETWTANRVP